MATPMTAAQFAAVLRAEGLTVVEVGDWEDHNRNHKGLWGPVHGVMIHHTVTSGSARTVAICRDGHTTLPGPLCHGVITKDGRVHLVGYGRTNHAGNGDPDVLRAVIDETALPGDDEATVDGNRHFYGFECENLGDGQDPWPAAQLLAIERAAAAICRHHGWDAGSVIGHLEWQPGKVDPRGFSMQTMRGRVAARLDGNQQEDDVALTADDINKIAAAVIGRFWDADTVPAARPPWNNGDYFKADGKTPGNQTWTPGYMQLTQVEGIRETLSRVKGLEARPALELSDADISTLASAVAADPALAEQIAEKVAVKLAERLAD